MKNQTISLEDALQAQSALRADAGLAPETFSLEAFVGMISDEIEQLRKKGRSDTEIANIVRSNSPVKLTAEDVSLYYAPPEARRPPGEG